MKSISLTGVGNEIMTLNESSNINIEDIIPDIIDYSFQIPSFNFPNLKIYSGYLYFNLTVETFDVQVWRGSTLCNVPSRIMVFPSGYKMNNGNTYWGTDFEPNMGTVKNNYVGFFGSTGKDILANWGLYDAQYLYFLRDFALYWIKLMDEYGSEWNNHLLDNPKSYNVAVGMENASNVMDAIGKYEVNGIVNLAKQKLGDAYNYVKDHPEILIKIGISYAVDEITGAILSSSGMAEGLAIIGAITSLGLTLNDTIHAWFEWKKTHGGGWKSFTDFFNDWGTPFDNNCNTHGFWNAWAKNTLDGVISIKNWLGFKPSSKSWDDWYNQLSHEDYNSIIGEEVNELSFMVRGCSYRMASYDGWIFPKYHIYSAYNFQKPKYELKRAKMLPNGDVFLDDLDFDINSLFNRPFIDLIMLKNWTNDYPLLSQVLEHNNINTLYICSTYPSYIQMKLFNIPRIKLG